MLGWNVFTSSFTGWDGVGTENVAREDLYCRDQSSGGRYCNYISCHYLLVLSCSTVSCCHVRRSVDQCACAGLEASAV